MPRYLATRSRRSASLSPSLSNGVLDVLRRREHGQQVESLEDESDGSCPELGKLVVGSSASDILPIDENLALRWCIDAADQVE